MIMNEAAKKIIEKANQTALLMQSIIDKLKESDDPQKDGIKLIERVISATENTIKWGEESQQ